MSAMLKLGRLLPRSPVGIGVSALLVLIMLAGSWKGLGVWWYRGFSKGQRTGVIRKFSYRGSPVCKYWLGELVLVGSNFAQQETWVFTTDATHESDAIIREIQQAAQQNHTVTLTYRQDLKTWPWKCAPSEYYVTGLAKN